MFGKEAKWIIDEAYLGLEPIIDVLDRWKIPPYEIFKEKIERFDHPEKLKNRHMLVRKEFICSATPKQAFIDITADDYYKLYINGKFVGQGPAPSYYFHYYYNRYDITDFLQVGKNVIAVHVYYQGLSNIVWQSGDLRAGMMAEINCDGSVVASTDATWKYKVAEEYVGTKIYGYATAYVEDIDNRRKLCGWKESDFDDSAWKAAAVNDNYDYTFFLQPTPPVQIYEITPKEIRTIALNNHIIDFGQEITARLIVSAEGKAGESVDISYGEELESPDKVRGNVFNDFNYNEKWVLADGENKLDSYDYKGFRYIQIRSDSAQVDFSTLRAEVRHYPFTDTLCCFKSSNPLLNKVWSICKNGVKYGTQEGYLDCPTRERGQYLGDALVTEQSHAYLTGDYRMFRKFLVEFSLSSKISAALQCNAPAGKFNGSLDYSLQWPLHLLNYYKFSGDADLLRELMPVTEGVVGYYKRFARRDGLIQDITEQFLLVDWPVNLRDNYDYDFPAPKLQKGCVSLINAYYIGMLQAVNKIKKILGIAVDGSEVQKLTKAFCRVFFDEETGLFVDREGSKHSSLHANALPLFFGFAPKNNNIVALIKEKRLCCGVFFSYFVLKGLANAGEYGFIYELLTASDEHSWGNMVKEGATTCFEVWGKKQKWNTSLCHPWASSPIIILIEDILGLKFDAGFTKMALKPHISNELTDISVVLPTPVGEIQIEYKDGKTTSNYKEIKNNAKTARR